MTIISAGFGASGDAYAQLVHELRLELDCVEIGAIAERIFEAEDVDFHWNARIRQRYLGQYVDAWISSDDADEGVARMAFTSFLAGRWHAGVCLVDGEGCPQSLLWVRTFHGREEAELAFSGAR